MVGVPLVRFYLSILAQARLRPPNRMTLSRITQREQAAAAVVQLARVRASQDQGRMAMGAVILAASLRHRGDAKTRGAAHASAAALLAAAACGPG